MYNNIKSVAILKASTLIFPLLTYTYVFGVVGASHMGEIVFVLSIIAFFRVLINFGFEISAVRSIACLVNVHTKNKFLISVLWAQVFFYCIGVFLIVSLGLITNNFLPNWHMYMPAYLMLLGEIFWLRWFFQGIEQMKYMAIVSIVVESSTLILSLLILNASENYNYFLYIKLFSAWLGGGVAVFIVISKLRYKVLRIKLIRVINSIFRSRSFFLSRIFSVLHGEVSTILIGNYFNFKDVAYFDLSRKIINVFLMPNSILNTVFFPYLSKRKDKIMVKKLFNIRNIISLFMIVVLFSAVESIVVFISNKEAIEAVVYAKLLSILILVRGIIYYTGTSVLVSFGYNKIFNTSVIYTVFLYIFGLVILILLGEVSVFNIILIMILSEGFEAVYRYYYCKIYNLL